MSVGLWDFSKDAKMVATKADYLVVPMAAQKAVKKGVSLAGKKVVPWAFLWVWLMVEELGGQKGLMWESQWESLWGEVKVLL